MSKRKRKKVKVNAISLPSVIVSSVATEAAAFLDDIRQTYGRAKVANVNRVYVPTTTGGIESVLGNVRSGELLVVGTRDQQLRDVLALRIAQSVASDKSRSVHMFSFKSSFLRMTRKLADAMSTYPVIDDIYNGQLDDEGIRRAVQVLTHLQSLPIFAYSCYRNTRKEVCDSAQEYQKNHDEIGIIIVDNFSSLTDDRNYVGNRFETLRILRELAVKLMVPVVVIDQLDPTIANHSILTRDELREYEAMADIADGVILMSGTAENLVFSLPKIPKKGAQQAESFKTDGGGQYDWLRNKRSQLSACYLKVSTWWSNRTP